MVRARNSAFRTGDQDLYSVARANLRRGVKAAKMDCKRKVEIHLTDNNPRQLWQGLKHLTNYRGNTSEVVNANAKRSEPILHSV